ncbi:amidase [soil metagenome]
MSEEIGPFSTATQMLAALRAAEVSSRELVELHVDRIEKFDPQLNSIAVPTVDRARAAAVAADERRAGGDDAPLLGLPMTLKESTLIEGMPQSAGVVELKEHVGAADGPVARDVFAAGACLLGTTNVPVALGDWQANSPNYGRTSNPWDLDRTPGGSTGGGGAALAAGLTPLEVGSDIGGSIRVPAAYCGVYGHRPSETAIPRAGSFPLADHPNPAAVLGVQGPLARSALDLELLFDVIAGPEVGEASGWKLDLPPARHDRLADFRVAVMPPNPWVQPSAAMGAAVDALVSFVGDAGCRVDDAMPALDVDQYAGDYSILLSWRTSQGMGRDKREEMAARFAARGDPLSAAQGLGLVIDAADLLAVLDRREAARAQWRAFYEDWDVLVGPMALDAAFPHEDRPWEDRTIDVDGTAVPYTFNIVYPMWAIFAGQPSTAFPAGLSLDGLPLGLQVIGPYLEDRTTLRFAQLLEREWKAFTPPPGY